MAKEQRTLSLWSICPGDRVYEIIATVREHGQKRMVLISDYSGGQTIVIRSPDGSLKMNDGVPPLVSVHTRLRQFGLRGRSPIRREKGHFYDLGKGILLLHGDLQRTLLPRT